MGLDCVLLDPEMSLVGLKMVHLIRISVQEAISSITGLHMVTLLRRNVAHKPVFDGSGKRGHFNANLSAVFS